MNPAPPSGAGDARWQRAAVAAAAALLLLELLWETVLAPLRPGGSWLALKALPLALVWPGLVRGSPRARLGMALLVLPLVAESVVRSVTETGRHAVVAGAAFALSTFTFAALVIAARRVGRSHRRAPPG